MHFSRWLGNGHIKIYGSGLYPEKRVYHVQQMPMTEAAIATGIFGDLYVSLGEPVSGGAWSVRVYHKPFVTWIWGGCIIMALGGLLALCDRRYRVATWRSEAPVATGSKKGRGVSPAAAR